MQQQLGLELPKSTQRRILSLITTVGATHTDATTCSMMSLSTSHCGSWDTLLHAERGSCRNFACISAVSICILTSWMYPRSKPSPAVNSCWNLFTSPWDKIASASDISTIATAPQFSFVGQQFHLTQVRSHLYSQHQIIHAAYCPCFTLATKKPSRGICCLEKSSSHALMGLRGWCCSKPLYICCLIDTDNLVSTRSLVSSPSLFKVTCHTSKGCSFDCSVTCVCGFMAQPKILLIPRMVSIIVYGWKTCHCILQVVHLQ